jgi:hypothetical protein
MTTAAVASMPVASRTTSLIAAGIVVGLSYTLSPLTVISLVVIAAAVIAASRGLTLAERRWYWSILIFSIVIRLAAIAFLFYTANPAHPFASFFGDEELYKFRTMWLRNIGQGIAMSPADVIYSYDAVGHTSYIYVLALVQAFVGDAPYGLHVFNMALCLCGVLALYRIVRRSYGGVIAMGGLIALLFMPTLGLWSISALKEPMNIFMIAVELIAAIAIIRAPRWWQKAVALAVVAVAAAAMESLRTGGILTAACGTAAGLLLSLTLTRGRRLAFAMIAAPAVIITVAAMPQVQQRVMTSVRRAAHYHAGHVLTPGYSYRLINSRYYLNRGFVLYELPASDASRFAVKAVWAYFVEPLPWEMKSTTLLAYMPEHIAWYLAALLMPIGVYAGMKRDIVLTSMLVAHAAAAIVIVALSSGNIGTLIRHRSLACPYGVWLSAAGAHECVRRFAERRVVLQQRSSADGDR